MTAEIVGGSEPAIKFTVYNRATTLVRLYNAELPWIYVGTLGAVLAPNSGQPITPNYHGGFPPTGMVEIPPGKSVSGDIRLGSLFHGFTDIVAKDDCIVYWSYFYPQYEVGVKKMDSKLFGGALFVPRTPAKSDAIEHQQ